MTRKVENKEQAAQGTREFSEARANRSKETRESRQRLKSLRSQGKAARKELERFQKKEQTAKRLESFEKETR